MTQDASTVEEKQFCDCYDHDFRRALVQIEKLLSLQPITEQSIDTARMYVIQAREIDTQKHMRHLEETIKAMEAHGNARYEEGVKAAYEHILTELHSYNNRSNCDPEWHDGFSEAIYKVEELLAFLTPTKTDKQ